MALTLIQDIADIADIADIQIDPFLAVLGRGRGRPEPEEDTLMSAHPTSRAFEELMRMHTSLGKKMIMHADAALADALATLLTMQSRASTPPLERRVRNDIARLSMLRATASTDHLLQTVLADACVRNPNTSEHVVGISDNNDRNDRYHDPSKYVHLWPQGSNYAQPADAGEIRLACGLTPPTERIHRLLRGKWSSPASSRWHSDAWRCRDCEEVIRPSQSLIAPTSFISLRAQAQVQAFGFGDHGPLKSRIDGEMRERYRHPQALPYHVHTRHRARLQRNLNEMLQSDCPSDVAALDACARGCSLAGAFGFACDEALQFQSGWLRRLGVALTPTQATRTPLLTHADIMGLLSGLYPRAYHNRDVLALGDYSMWQTWLSSSEYAQARATLPAAAAARLRTRARGR
jgi:hypothetical protein